MGRKRHLFVDTEGFVLAAFVTEANYHDGTVASWLIAGVVKACPRLSKIWADQAYGGAFADCAHTLGIEVEVVGR